MWREDRYPRLVAGNGDAISWCDALMGSWPVLSGAVGLERGLRTVEAALAGLERDASGAAAHALVRRALAARARQDRRLPARSARERRPVFARLVLAGRRRWSSSPRPHGADGEHATAERLRARAFDVWRKISPLDKTRPGLLDIYGLPPHQQPADIYFGPGYEVRGGWSWYTGAAARMLTAAYAILGLKLVDGESGARSPTPSPPTASCACSRSPGAAAS